MSPSLVSPLLVSLRETGRPAEWLLAEGASKDAHASVGAVGCDAPVEPCFAFLLALEDRLREIEARNPGHAEMGELARAACGMVAAHLGVTRVLLLRLADDGRCVPADLPGEVHGRGAALCLADFGVSSAQLAGAQAVRVADIRLDPRLTNVAVQSGWAARHVLALAAVPVLENGAASALLVAADRHPAVWRDADLVLLRYAGARIWRALARAGSQAALRRKTTEAALTSSEERFARALAGARVGIWEFDIAADTIEVSPGCAETFFGRPGGSIRCMADFEVLVHPDDRAAMAAEFARVGRQVRLGGQADYRAEFRTVLPGGDIRWLGIAWRYTAEPGTGRDARLSGVLVDMSERRRAELELNATKRRLQEINTDLEAQVRREVEAREQAQAQLAQAQRLEALGQLAGGIAHDFNNVLQGVRGGLDLLERRADRPDQVRRLAVRTGEAVARGVAITGRLLSLARRSELHAQPVQVPPLLDSLHELLAPALGADITLRVASQPDLHAFLADKVQLETVLVNLAVNARQAMPHGGTLSVEARQAAVHAGATLQPGLPPGLGAGSYVRISVQDTGTGMTPEILARACDPFFTTRPVGQATGLGLAMARGFAEQSGGGLMLFSQPGTGTTVSLWLPAVPPAQSPGSAAMPAGVTLAGRSPCVLIVDDDERARSTLAGLLVDLGCTVIEAESAAFALAYLRAGAPVDLVVTDYVMRGMTGAALATVIRQNHPGLSQLLIAGSAEASFRINMIGWDPARTVMLRKPLSAGALANAVSTLLGTCSATRPVESDPAA